MTALGIVIICLFLIAIIPCGLFAAYGPNGIKALLILGPVRINLLREKSKKKEGKKKSGKPKKKASSKGKLVDFLPILDLVLEFLSDFRRKLTIKDLQFKLILAGDDPCDLSLNYGRTWAAVGNVFPLLESWFTIKKRNIQVACDYTADTTIVDGSIDLRLRFATLLHMVLHHGIRILIKYYKTTKHAKDGAAS